MSKMKEWLLDRQENGDDGTGFTDYTIEGECDKCEGTYELSDRTNRCGECGNCNNCCTHEREKASK
jgi:hypothetical protein